MSKPPVIEQGIFGPTLVKPEKRIPSPMPTFGNQRLSRHYKGYIPGKHHPEYFPARNQGDLELLVNAFGQIGSEAVFGLTEAIGYTADITSWMEPWVKPGTVLGDLIGEGFFRDLVDQGIEFLDDTMIDQIGEFVHGASRDIKNWVREDGLKIYDTPRSGNIGNGRWLAQNIGSLGSFIGLLIPAGFVGRIGGLAAKTMGAGANMQRLIGGIAGATVSRHSEGMMESYGLYDDLIRQGHSHEEAAAAAAKNYRDNAALFFVDVLQFGHLLRPGASGLKKLFSRAADKPSKWRRAGDVAFQMVTEGGEEGFQTLAQKEAEYATYKGEGPGPLGFFGKNFLNRVDNYLKDSELWTSVILGALGGAVAPVVVNTLSRAVKSPPKYSQEYEERLRSQTHEMLSEGENQYLDGKRFMGNAIHFAGQGRMGDMETILNAYIEEYEDNPEHEGPVSRAKEALEIIPEFEEIYNEEQVRPDYTRGEKFENIKDPASFLRAVKVGNRFMLKMDERLQQHYNEQFEKIIEDAPGFDRRYEELYRRKTIMDAVNENISDLATAAGTIEGVSTETRNWQQQKIKEYEQELKRLEDEGVDVSNIEDKLKTTQDEKLQELVLRQEDLRLDKEEKIDLLKDLSTEKGIRQYLRNQNELVGKEREGWLSAAGGYIGPGVKVGNEFNQFEVKAARDPDRFILERTDQLTVEDKPVSHDEADMFRGDGSISPERRVNIARKVATKQKLSKVEQEMYEKHKDAINNIRETNMVDNDGEGFSQAQLLDYLWNNSMDTLDTTQHEILMDQVFKGAELKRLSGERETAISEIAKLEREIEIEQKKLTENPGESDDKLKDLQNRLAEQEARLSDTEEEIAAIDDHPLLFKNMNKTSRAEGESDVLMPTVDNPINGKTTFDKESGWAKYAVHVFRTLYGSHRKVDPVTKKHVEQLTENPAQKRFFKFVDSNKIYGQKLYLKLFSVVDNNGEIIRDHLDMFVPQNERERMTEGAKKKPADIINLDTIHNLVKNLDYDRRVEQLEHFGIIRKKTTMHVNGRYPIVIDVDGKPIPFYRSSKGTSGKQTGKWYPFFGMGKDGWFVKGTLDEINNNYGSGRLKRYVDFLDRTLDWDHAIDKKNEPVDEHPYLGSLNEVESIDQFNKEVFGYDSDLSAFTPDPTSGASEWIKQQVQRAEFDLDAPLRQVLRDSLYAVVVNEKGQYVDPELNTIKKEQVPSLGLFSSMMEPDGDKARKRVMHDKNQLDQIKGETQRYEYYHDEITKKLRGIGGKPVDVFIPVISKSFGVTIDSGTVIPIGSAAKNRKQARIIVGLPFHVNLQGRQILFNQGFTYMIDEASGKVFQADKRAINRDNEIETVYQLLMQGARAPKGYDSKIGGKLNRTYEEALKHYIHWREADGTNRGGVAYAKRINKKMHLYLEALDGNKDGENTYDIDTLTEEQVKDWIRAQKYNINSEFLASKATKNYNYITYYPDRGAFDYVNTRQKYSDWLLDPNRDILTTNAPAYDPSVELPQVWNANLMFEYSDYSTGKPEPPSEKIPKVEPTTSKEGSRQKGKWKKIKEKATNAVNKTVDVGKQVTNKKSNKGKGGNPVDSGSVFRNQGEKHEWPPEFLEWFNQKLKENNEEYTELNVLLYHAEWEKLGKPSVKKAPVEQPVETSGKIPPEFYDWYYKQIPKGSEEDTERNTLIYFEQWRTEVAGSNQDSKTSPKTDDDLLSDFLGKEGVPPGLSRSVELLSSSNYIPENIEQTVAWFKIRFPEVDIEVVHDLMKQGAMGRFTEFGRVLLDSAAEEGTLYHEAYHATSYLFMTEPEARRMYNEYRKRYGNKNMTDRQAEEGLAELFRMYVLTGQLPEAKPIRNWFTRLLDFIRTYFGLDTRIKRTFERISNGYYAHMTPDYSRLHELTEPLNRDISMRLPDRTVQYTKEAVTHLHLHFLDAVRESGLRNVITTDGLTPRQFKQIYDRVYDKIGQDIAEYYSKADQMAKALERRVKKRDIPERTVKVVNNHIAEMMNYAESFEKDLESFYSSETNKSWVRLHSEYMRTLKIDVEEETIDELETLTDPDNKWAEETTRKSLFMSAPNSVRFWLSGVIDRGKATGRSETTSNGFRKGLPNAFGIVAKTLANTTDIEDQIVKFQEIIVHHPGLNEAFKDFALDGVALKKPIDELDAAQYMRRAAFFQTFAKYYENYNIDVAQGSKIYRARTNDANLKRQIRNAWEGNYQPKLPKDVRSTIANNEGFSFEDAIKTAEAIGMEIPSIKMKEGDVYMLPDSLKNIVTKKMSHIANNLYKSKKYNPYTDLRGQGDVNSMVNIEFIRSPEYSEGSHYNPEGNSVYDILEYSYYYYTVAGLNTVADEIRRVNNEDTGYTLEQGREKIYEKFPHYRHPYYRTSKILDHIAGGNRIVTGIEEGINSNNNNTEFKKLREPDRFIKEILDLTRGVYHILRPADNSIERTFTLANSADVGAATDEEGNIIEDMSVSTDYLEYPTEVATPEAVISKLQEYLKDELAFLDDAISKRPQMTENWKNYTENIKNYSGIVMSMVTSGTEMAENRILNFLTSSGDLATRQGIFINDSEVIKALQYSFNGIIYSDVIPTLRKYRVQELGFLGKNTLWSDMSEEELASFITISYLKSSIEQTKIFTGHPAQYKNLDDMVKRLSGAVGPKTLSMVDPRSNEYLEKKFKTDGDPYLGVAYVEDPIVASSRFLKPVHDYLFMLPSQGKDYGIISESPYLGKGEHDRVFMMGYKGKEAGTVLYNSKKKSIKIESAKNPRKAIVLVGEYLGREGVSIKAEDNQKIWEALAKEDRVTVGKNDYVYKPQGVEMFTSADVYNTLEEALIERFGEEYGKRKAKLYESIVESDAHGYWTMEAYRILHIRSGDWDYKREASWQWQMQGGWKGEKVTIGKDNPFVELQGKTITRKMVEQPGYLLPPTKPQAFGPNVSANMINMLKFAATPLIPELIQGTALEQLAEKAKNDGTGLTIFHTGSKTGTPLEPGYGTPSNLYDPYGNLNSNPFINDALPWQYIGIQVANAPNFKNESSQGTQKERHIESDLYEQGVPVDFLSGYREIPAKVPFDQAVAPAKIDRFPAYKSEKIYLSTFDLGERITVDRPFEDVKKAYDIQKGLLDEAKLAFEGDPNNTYKEILGDPDMTDYQLGAELLNEALYNIVKIRRILGLPTIDIRGIKEKVMPPAGTVNYQEAINQWNSLDEYQKKTRSPIHRMVSRLREIEGANIEYGLMLAKEKLGLQAVTDNGEVVGYRVDNNKIERAKNWLYRKLSKQRNTSANMLESIRWLQYGTDAMVNSQDVEIILRSLISSSTTNRKVKGKNLMLMPSTLMELKRAPYYYNEEDDKISYQASDLKTYTNDQGKIISMEVYMPHWFEEMYGKEVNIKDIDPRLTKILGFRIPTQALSSLESIIVKDFLPVTANDIVIVPSEIVTKTGADFDFDKLFVNLPNYEIVDGEVKYAEYLTDEEELWEKRKRSFTTNFATDEYLEIQDAYYGALVDMIADKQTQYETVLKAIGDEGFTSKLPKDVKNALSGVWDFIWDRKEFLQESQLNIESAVIAMEEVRETFTQRVEDIKALKEERDAQLRELYKKYRSMWQELPIDLKNGHERLDNLKIELQRTLLLKPERFGELNAPVTIDEGVSVLKDTGNRLLEEREKRLKEYLGDDFYAAKKRYENALYQVGNPVYMQKKGYELQTAKQNISIGALAATAHINFAQANVYIDNINLDIPYNIYTDKTDTSYPSFAGLKDSSSKYYISDLINELVSAYADSPNDPFIHEIGGSGENATIFAMMLSLGVPADYLIALMNQPLIKHYSSRLDVEKSAYFNALRKEGSTAVMGPAEFTRKYKESYRRDYKVSYDSKHIANTNKLWRQATIPFVPDSAGNPLFMDTGEWDHAVQYSALVKYLQLKDLASDYFKYIQASTYNTKHGGKNILSAMLLNEMTEDLITRGPEEVRFVNYNRLFKDGGFLAPHRRAVQESIKILTPFHTFMNNDSIVRMIKDNLIAPMIRGKEFMSFDDQIGVLDRFRSELATAIYHSYYGDRRLFLDERSLIETYEANPVTGKFDHKKINNTIPRRTKELKKLLKKSNYLIDNFVPHLRNKTHIPGHYIDNMTLKGFSGKKVNPMELEMYTDAWRELHEQFPEYSKDLFKFLMLQAGTTESPANFLRIVPNEIFAGDQDVGMINALKAFMPREGDTKTKNMYWFFDQFALNNRDNRIFRWVASKRTISSMKENDAYPFMVKTMGGLRKYYVNGKEIYLRKEKKKDSRTPPYPTLDFKTYASLKDYNSTAPSIFTDKDTETGTNNREIHPLSNRPRRIEKLEQLKSGKRVSIKKVIAGGQWGIDMDSLEIADSLGYETGGTAPYGWRTERGPRKSDLEKYGLVEGPYAKNAAEAYRLRTIRNIENSDVTVIFAQNRNSPGTKLTIQEAEKMNRPLIINPDTQELRDFIADYKPEVINFAGNRQTGMTQEFINYARRTIREALLPCS